MFVPRPERVWGAEEGRVVFSSEMCPLSSKCLFKKFFLVSIKNLSAELSAIMCDHTGQESLRGSVVRSVLLWLVSPPRGDAGYIFLRKIPTNLNKIPRTARNRGCVQKCLCLFIRKKLRARDLHSCGQILTGFSQLLLKTGLRQWFLCCPESPGRDIWHYRWHFRHSGIFLSTGIVYIWVGCKSCFVGGYGLGFPCG